MALKNIIEDLVSKELENAYNNFPEACRCQQCRSDVTAIVLNQLPPQYVNGKRMSESSRHSLTYKYTSLIPSVMLKAIAKVKEHPRQECERIKNNLYRDASSILAFYRP